MSEAAGILVVAATERELTPARGWRSLTCGVGPMEAAVTTTAELQRARPAALLHVGIAGARRDRAFPPAAIIIGSEARYCDLASGFTLAPRTLQPDVQLLRAAQRLLPEAHTLPIGTTARVGGSQDCDVEAMEGFAVLRAAAQVGVPAIEIRVISNDIEEHDRRNWHFDHAFTTVQQITPLLVAEFARCVR